MVSWRLLADIAGSRSAPAALGGSEVWMQKRELVSFFDCLRVTASSEFSSVQGGLCSTDSSPGTRLPSSSYSPSHPALHSEAVADRWAVIAANWITPWLISQNKISLHPCVYPEGFYLEGTRRKWRADTWRYLLLRSNWLGNCINFDPPPPFVAHWRAPRY